MTEQIMFFMLSYFHPLYTHMRQIYFYVAFLRVRLYITDKQELNGQLVYIQ